MAASPRSEGHPGRSPTRWGDTRSTADRAQAGSSPQRRRDTARRTAQRQEQRSEAACAETRAAKRLAPPAAEICGAHAMRPERGAAAPASARFAKSQPSRPRRRCFPRVSRCCGAVARVNGFRRKRKGVSAADVAAFDASNKAVRLVPTPQCELTSLFALAGRVAARFKKCVHIISWQRCHAKCLSKPRPPSGLTLTRAPPPAASTTAARRGRSCCGAPSPGCAGPGLAAGCAARLSAERGPPRG